MEARSERREGVLIFFVTGRLDAFGAQQMDTWAREALNDDDKELVPRPDRCAIPEQWRDPEF